MHRIDTPLTRLLGITSPIVTPPMAGASGGALAAQTTIGGGFGFIASGYESLDVLGNEIALARSTLVDAQKSHPDGDVLPIGVGFFGWLLEKDESKAKESISFALDNKVQAVWFSFGRDLGKWVQFVREYDQRKPKSHRTVVFVLVNTLQEASSAISDWKVDVVITGNEAGGHGLGAAPSLLTLLPLVLNLSDSVNGPPVLAAGGLATGSHIASMLTLGASGVVMGTRFLLSPESLYSDEQRRALIEAGPTSTVRSMAFDNARGTLEWPEGVDGRGLLNDTVRDFNAGLQLEELQRLLKQGTTARDPARMVVWAGTGVGLMKSIKPAAHIIQELHSECEENLGRVKDMI
ncbi:2-nitropropane dioxygenase [Moniliophthora roreri MCA 2997]|uniref:2-nitropropane dioxygenase n=1 Tax=Moniliophthora roreri (strain MCA 2997) TaxID=1381753 RepID=V2YXG5_MONRO|nr:2-nitropropane dioxygenase [Moniliophthora roreri MCA 2997]